ncbi:unnamed protein product [Peronospora belbahrii]|uniref:SEC7 domain-containing protein n=1 Tax=Peronospora belbahrii TaxID=622444 RepID=A0ABN8CTJ7_9STRA|nr:unnamed protein product [Peronospora belbahrii]
MMKNQVQQIATLTSPQGSSSSTITSCDLMSIEAMQILRLMGPESPSTPEVIAEYLREMTDSKMIGQILGEPDAKTQRVLHEYANMFQFHNVSFDIAIRVYLGRFELPREAQKIDRILQAFAKAYYSQNSHSLECPSEDAVYTLAFSVLLLNTDAHNPKLARKFKMTRADFIRNYHQLGVGDSNSASPEVPDTFLGYCYDLFVMDAIRRIERKPIELQPHEVELEFPEKALGLEIETSFDGQTAVVKAIKKKSSFLTSGANFLAAGSSIFATILASVDSEPEISVVGWVIVAVGDDDTRQIGYAMSRYLLKTAPRPVLIRFCEPSMYFASLE